ncbi:MAG: P1 family peptidase, partial [Pseudomonadota bacterium]
MPTGPRNLITDVSGLLVGNASDTVLKSGVTVLTSDHPFRASVDIRGGAPGTRDTALLEPERTVDQIDALVLSGGSAFGLGAAEGVMAALRAAGRGFAVGPVHVPIVPTAIIFDLANGGAKDWVESSYPALGRSAFDAAAPTFEIGTAGAGVGALTARLKGGLGSTSARVGEWTVGALVVANPIGHVSPPGSRQFWAGAFEEGAEFGNLGAPRSTGPIGLGDTKLGAGIGSGGNTTIAIVATDAPLDKVALRRLAVAAQDGIARAIVPAHT